MIAHYFPVLVFLIIGVLMGLAPVILGMVIAPRRPDKAKNSTYECGFEPFGDARLPFDVRFYLVAILFILFDLETAFLVPWAVTLNHTKWFGFWEMMVFLLLLVIGFVYEWKKGGLEWE